MRKQILIITYSGDNYSIERVTDHIQELGGEAVRLNVDEYPLHQLLTVDYANGKKQISLQQGEKVLNLNSLESIWYRRLYNLGKCLTEELDPKYASAALGECRTTILGLLAGLETDTFCANSYNAVRYADAKERQLRVADSLGLRIPKTCITNNPATAKVFIDSCKAGAISKMQSSFAVKEGNDDTVVFTNDVTSEDIERLDGLRYCPMKFQEKIQKQLELRVTTVGNQCFTIAIDSQKKKEGSTDWRKLADRTMTDWVPYNLPAEIAEKLVAYNQYFHLNYSASDVLLTPEGEYIFLEANPGGEFMWADEILDGAITKHMAKLFMGEVPRLAHSPYAML